MTTRVTAAEVSEASEVWHGPERCRVIRKRTNRRTGAVFIQWTEDMRGREVTFGGSFAANAYFGETSTA